MAEGTATTEMEEVEVDPAIALAESKTDQGRERADRKTAEAAASTDDQNNHDDILEPKTAQEVLDAIVPMSKPRVQKLGPDAEGETYEFVQRELGFISKSYWFSLVGEVMDRALGGENRLSLEALFSPPEGWGPNGIDMKRMSEADTFMHAISKLIKFMPDFMEESFCIWLDVPDYMQPHIKELMKKNGSEGGISDDDGFEIIETFIDQNWIALEEWFRGKAASLGQRIEKRRQESLSRRSTPSSSTAPTTPNP